MKAMPELGGRAHEDVTVHRKVDISSDVLGYNPILDPKEKLVKSKPCQMCLL